MAEPLARVAQVRVRYGETDQMRFAYHAHAAVWFDVARTALLAARGRRYRDLEEAGLWLPVLALRVEYHLAAHYDDELDLLAAFRPVHGPGGQASPVVFEILYEVRRGAELCYSGSTRHCFLEERGGRRRPRRLPDWMLELLAGGDDEH
jgi:acyl-CoA thioester hydrolase